ncbi:precorrin-6A synthase (deacetylating) [Hydrogenophaga intermedia]|uniref:precorrin-6A synthase (deacetylating) n=1 Tax=Hydrogenophaga intermedia TaxID=65786 RepID=UPI00204354A2|nr:precorrin-6A synthase (deacetylating) [Hydrogenophaga intermedia]MCM3566026.1 precorrin-6A synthase (deacetylating) [Hydrogenophaga intermedia]
MIHLSLIGIGTGDPEHLTLQAIRALNRADLILLPRKGPDKSDLAELRRLICASHVSADAQVVEFDLPQRVASATSYLESVHAWHDAVASCWGKMIGAHRPNGGTVALMVWGDPSLYDSSLRIAERLRSRGLQLQANVIPGLTSLQLLAAVHSIPLNTLGAPVMITTGRHLRNHGWPQAVDTLVVMLDGECSFEKLPPQNTTIYWAAYLGMPQQLMLCGPLESTGPRIRQARVAARAEHGWIMDIYLLRRRDGPRAH